MKTSELTGAALDWAVAKCEGPRSVAACYYDDTEMPVVRDEADRQIWTPSTDWSQGGPIIEREKISTNYRGGADPNPKPDWRAVCSFDVWRQAVNTGPTPLIAAMRCYVASKLGDEVEVPEGLA